MNNQALYRFAGVAHLYLHADDRERMQLAPLVDSTTFAAIEFWAWCVANKRWHYAHVIGLA